MRRIDHIVIHCSATPPSQDIGADTIRQWHVDGNGWSDIGYHYVIRRSGVLETGRPMAKAGAHVRGHNEHSIGICVVGGTDESGKSEPNFTGEQWEHLRMVIDTLAHVYPEADLCGHRDFPDVAKDCPCFDVKHWHKTGELT